jgi:hypothetical protein
MGSATGVIFPADARFFSLSELLWGAFSLLSNLVPGTLSPVPKWPGREANQSPLSNSKVKNAVAIPPLSKTSYVIVLN